MFVFILDMIETQIDHQAPIVQFMGHITHGAHWTETPDISSSHWRIQRGRRTEKGLVEGDQGAAAGATGRVQQTTMGGSVRTHTMGPEFPRQDHSHFVSDIILSI